MNTRLMDTIPKINQHNIWGVPRFIIDNVADYFYTSGKYDERNLASSWQVSDFPTLTPPFHKMWMEYRLPEKLGTGFQGALILEQRPFLWREHWEALTDNSECDDIRRANDDFLKKCSGEDRDTSVFACLAQLMLVSAFQIRVTGDMAQAEAMKFLHWELATRLPALHWLLVVNPVLGNSSQAQLPQVAFILGLSSTGSVLTETTTGIPYCVSGETRNHEFSTFMPEGRGDWLKTHWLYPFLLSLSLMHCRNVSETAITRNKKQSADYRRRTGLPLVQYKILNIDPMKKVLRDEGQSDSLGLKRALHITRGHFADYTAGKGLFGRYHGTYWVPQHVKGSANHGVVEKDYSVLAPKEDTR